MSQINTNGINVNYPIPGVNNNSQGFRDNFSAIKTNIDAASIEISDIQNKVLLKSALDNQILNNDMANALISNALTRGFRASTYNLGNAISGTVIINASQGDVHYGSIAGNTTLQFAGWAPSGTQSNIQLVLAISNANAVLSFPPQVKLLGSFGAETLENFSIINNVATVSIPAKVTQVEYRLSTLDCGNSITIEPINRPRQSTQFQQRVPIPQGSPGDITGTVCIEPNTSLAFEICVSSDSSTGLIFTKTNTTGFYLDMPIEFTGFVGNSSFLGPNIYAGQRYYVRTISKNKNSFSVSTLPGTVNGPGVLVPIVTGTGNITVTPIHYMYLATGFYDSVNNKLISRTVESTAQVTKSTTGKITNANGNITLSSAADMVVNNPIRFSATNYSLNLVSCDTTGNLTISGNIANLTTGTRIQIFGTSATFAPAETGKSYFIKNIDPTTSNIKISNSFNGVDLMFNSNNTSPTTVCTAQFGNIAGVLMGNLNSANTYYVKTIDTNSNNITVSDDINGTVLLLDNEESSWNLTATAVTDYTISVTAGPESINENDPVVFTNAAPLGITPNLAYYVSNVNTSSTTFSVSQTRNNGISGQKVPLANSNSSGAIATFTQGTSIWKRTPFSAW